MDISDDLKGLDNPFREVEDDGPTYIEQNLNKQESLQSVHFDSLYSGEDQESAEKLIEISKYHSQIELSKDLGLNDSQTKNTPMRRKKKTNV